MTRKYIADREHIKKFFSCFFIVCKIIDLFVFHNVVPFELNRYAVTAAVFVQKWLHICADGQDRVVIYHLARKES